MKKVLSWVLAAFLGISILGIIGTGGGENSAPTTPAQTIESNQTTSDDTDDSPPSGGGQTQTDQTDSGQAESEPSGEDQTSSDQTLPEQSSPDRTETEEADETETDQAGTEQTTPEQTKPEETEPPVLSPTDNFELSNFEIHFIDVGQADAALVICDDQTMLIDGGNSADSSLIYTYLKDHGISHIDYMIGTHAHEDHIGGLSGALNYATVGTVFCPVTSYDSKAFTSFVKYVTQQGVSITVPKAGDTFSLGNASVKILACNAGNDTNNTSIVLKITYGSTSFLFTGDAERETEQAILGAGYDLSSTVLKVGHHGADTSTTYPFLREIMPKYAVISVGANNSYGHPTENTLSRLRDADVKVYRTDMQGTIICSSDGQNVTFSVSKNPDADTLYPVSKPGSVETPAETDSTPETTPSTSETTPSADETTASSGDNGGTTYVLNTNTKKFHYESCSSAGKISAKNKDYYTGDREDLIEQGYSPCGICDP